MTPSSSSNRVAWKIEREHPQEPDVGSPHCDGSIVEYHQAFINDQGELCIMMEFCPGGDLARVIQGRKAERKCFSEKDVTAVMLGLVQALSYW